MGIACTEPALDPSAKSQSCTESRKIPRQELWHCWALEAASPLSSCSSLFGAPTPETDLMWWLAASAAVALVGVARGQGVACDLTSCTCGGVDLSSLKVRPAPLLLPH